MTSVTSTTSISTAVPGLAAAVEVALQLVQSTYDKAVAAIEAYQAAKANLASSHAALQAEHAQAPQVLAAGEAKIDAEIAAMPEDPKAGAAPVHG